MLLVLAADAAFMNGARLLARYYPEGGVSLHAVALVGYGPGGFVIRNSWGAEWGEDGHLAATEGYLAQATVESYGVAL